MTVTERVEKFDFSDVSFSSLENADLNGKEFILKIKIKNFPKNRERNLIVETPYFSVCAVRFHLPEDEEKLNRLEKKDKIGIFADDNGDVFILELCSTFTSPFVKEDRSTAVDLILNVYDARNNYAYAYYDGLKLGWIFGGEEVNYDYIFGQPVKTNTRVFSADDIELFFSNDFSAVKKSFESKKSERSFAFYSPRGYNAWAGDVVNFYHNGTYHLLFLYDRHHHLSRWGGGAHTMYHFVTKDYKNWQECPPLVDLDEQWKSLGTGTMFFSNGKYYFTHGWHTSRMIPEENTGSRLMSERAIDKKKLSPITYDELKEKNLFPSGANYVTSDDGIHFESGRCMFHISENPSVYQNLNGGLFMCGGYGSSGIWKADSIDGEWRLDENEKIPYSKLEPSDECPSMFEYKGYKYLLLGGTGYWKTEKNGNEYIDQAINGFDVYDGLSYPMVTVTDDGRMIMAGWIRGLGWGSVVIHRELIQGEDGRLYSKWLKELAPDKTDMKKLPFSNGEIPLSERRSYYIEFDVDPNENAKTIVRFSGSSKTVLIIDSERETVQISGGEEDVLPLYRIVNEGKDRNAIGDLHFQGENFAIGQVDNIDKPYKVRIILYYEKKSDNAIIDCEIGEKRTIVSNRVDQRFFGISVDCTQGELNNIEVYEI